MKPSTATAACAGVLASTGLLVLRTLLANTGLASAGLRQLLLAGCVALVHLLPAYYLVRGAGQAPFERLWFKDAAETRRFIGILNRTVVWFLAAVLTSLLLAAVLPRGA